jgi:hypothetical protein
MSSHEKVSNVGAVVTRSLLAFFLVIAAAETRAHESTLHRVLAQTNPASVARVAGPVAPLTIELRLSETSEPIAGLVRITSVASGQLVELPAHLRRPMNWHSLPALARIEVPAGELQIEACHGLDTEISTTRIVVEAGNTAARARIILRRFYEPAKRGLVSANTHLHLQLNNPRGMGGAALRTRREAEEYLTGIGKSDALDLVYVSYLVRAGESQNYVSNEFTRDDLQRLSSPEARFINGEEHRHEGGRSTRRGGPGELRYGHVLFLDLPRLVEPVSYGAIFASRETPSDAVPMQRAIRAAREQNATIIWCHGRQGTEDVPNWIAGVLHAQNIFDGGSEGTVDTIFYPYLNAGLRVPFSTGTDWGCYDLSRVYVPIDGEPTSAEFLRNLAAGRSFITNGPLLEFKVEGRAIGDTLELTSAGAVNVLGRSIGRDDFGGIEVVFNGTVIARQPSRQNGGHFTAELEQRIEIKEPGWLALRIPAKLPYNDRTQYTGAGANLFGKALFAHTSAVYLNIGGKSICQPPAVRQLIDEIDTSMRTIEAKGAFASDAEREGLLAIYRQARAALEARQ